MKERDLLRRIVACVERYDNELPVLGDFVLWVLPEDVRKHFKREAYSLRIDIEYLDVITGKVKTKSDLRNFLRRYSDIYVKLKNSVIETAFTISTKPLLFQMLICGKNSRKWSMMPLICCIGVIM